MSRDSSCEWIGRLGSLLLLGLWGLVLLAAPLVGCAVGYGSTRQVLLPGEARCGETPNGAARLACFADDDTMSVSCALSSPLATGLFAAGMTGFYSSGYARAEQEVARRVAVPGYRKLDVAVRVLVLLEAACAIVAAVVPMIDVPTMHVHAYATYSWILFGVLAAAAVAVLTWFGWTQETAGLRTPLVVRALVLWTVCTPLTFKNYLRDWYPPLFRTIEYVALLAFVATGMLLCSVSLTSKPRLPAPSAHDSSAEERVALFRL